MYGHAKNTAMHVVPSRFSRNSEANASELQENCEEMFPHYR